MKKLLTIFFLFCAMSALAQSFNNEWIDYNKTYYKFKVGASGLYRIPQSALAAINQAGAVVSSFQLWRNGEEIPIYTSSQSGVLPADGYIEFWGEANDGKPDQALYRNPLDHINSSKSLFTDTVAYFLTINPGGNNKRLVPTANNIPAGAVAEPYFMHTTSLNPNESIHLGPYAGQVSEPAISASYEGGEGWTSGEIDQNQTRTISQSALFPFTGAGAPPVQINMNVVGNSANSRSVRMKLNSADVFDVALAGFNYSRLTNTVPVSVLTGSSETILVSNISATPNNRIKIASLELSYPRIYNFGGAGSFRFRLSSGNVGRYLEIANFNSAGSTVALYDIANGRRYEADISTPSLIKVYVQGSSINQELVLANHASANIKSITSLEVRNFVNFSIQANQGDYLMITHNAILAGPNGSAPVEEYRAYRSSAAGGGYNAKVYMIDQLTDQFAYGIKGSPLSVRNFLRFARGRFSAPPKSVFIVGKGVKYTAARYNESNPVTDRLNLVPTFGEPASDMLLAAEGASSVPLTPIGRVSVINGNELSIYLEKMKQYDQHLIPVPGVDASGWKKNVIHMIGANEEGLINQLLAYLNQQKGVVQDTFYGASVSEFVKTSAAGSEQTNAERLKSTMNQGVNLLTYFGHSSTETLTFNLENPDNYNNAGKYPIFHMMGCNVGDIFTFNANRLSAVSTISEKYLLAKDRGCIGMMAGTALGFVSTLGQYNQKMYELLAREGYGRTLGDIMQAAVVKTFAASGGESSPYVRSQCEEYTLNGDPAVKLYQFDKPDYVIESQLVSVSPSIISASDGSFSIKAKMANIGKAIRNNVIVELRRTYPDQSTRLVQRDTIPGIRYADSLTYQISINPVLDKGINRFTITIDPDNLINELFETNNAVTREVIILEDDIKPVYPYDFAIVNNPDITFSASTGNAFAPVRNYVMEMDTTNNFTSPGKVTQQKSSAGGLVQFSPSVSFRDSTVYYWRVSAVPLNGQNDYFWSKSSFTYLSGNRTGFSQVPSKQQMADNSASGNTVRLNSSGVYVYDSLRAVINVRNAFFPQSGITLDWFLHINDIPVQGGRMNSPLGNPQANSLRFYLIDNKTMKAVQNQDMGSTGMYGSYEPIPRNANTVLGFFQFDISTTAARKNVMAFMDSIPDNYFVGLTSNIEAPMILPAEWKADTAVLGKDVSLYHKLKSVGLTSIDMVDAVVPYVFIYQKGNPNVLAQEVGTSAADRLSVSATVPVSNSEGILNSTVFNRATAWQTLSWDGFSLEQPSTDQGVVSILGIDKTGAQVPLMTDIPLAQKSVDISSINARVYSSIQVQMRLADTANRSPYQVKYWRINATPAPEGAITPNLYFVGKDTVEAGEPLNLGVAFKNVSNQRFDSLSVKLSLRDQNNVERVIAVPKIKPLVAGDTTKISVPIDTKSLTGSNLVYLEVNPEGDQHQTEQYQFNNFLFRNLFVKKDSINPYLDVTFDGSRILNRDIVSSKPDILMKLTDDARYLLLNNPDLVKVQLKHPNGIVRNYGFNNDTLTFTPPTQADNSNTATVSFKPHLMEDGEYELIVTATDESGNSIGAINYRVAFQVINKPMISNLLNYPNPFTSSTAFVFTLTGSEVPQNMRIQILTVTGKIVREITKAELGPLRIGRNITEFKWDGTDQYGQKLGNGVYLYRVITNLNGRSLDKYSTADNNTDKYFNKGYGKMVLIR